MLLLISLVNDIHSFIRNHLFFLIALLKETFIAQRTTHPPRGFDIELTDYLLLDRPPALGVINSHFFCNLVSAKI